VDENCIDYGPVILPAIPRTGEVIDGEWIGKDAEYEVVRVFYCVPTDYCDAPHVHLYITRLEEERPRDEDLRDAVRRALKQIEKLALALVSPMKPDGATQNPASSSVVRVLETSASEDGAKEPIKTPTGSKGRQAK
jgi:hypothetical protein